MNTFKTKITNLVPFDLVSYKQKIKDNEEYSKSGCGAGSAAYFNRILFKDRIFTGENFESVNFQSCRFEDCKFNNCEFKYANFNDCEFHKVDVSGSDISKHTKFNYCFGDKTVKFKPFAILPMKGQFHAFKKVIMFLPGVFSSKKVVVELLIHKDAKRMNMIGGRKCRCSKAKIIGMITKGGNTMPIPPNAAFRSQYDRNFSYKVGEWVEVKNFDDNSLLECTRGIHFFMTPQEAHNY